MNMTKLKVAIVAAVVLGGAVLLMWVQRQAQLKAREENRALQQQVEQLAAENERLSNQVAQASARAPVAAGEQERELLRLRSEVGALKRQVAEAARIQAMTPKTAPAVETAAPPPPDDELKRAGIAKMNFTRAWYLAFLSFSEKNQDQMPASFEQAAPFLSDEGKAEASQLAAAKYGLTTDQYEIVYQGSIKSLPSPQNVIVVREKQAWQTPDGSWMRAYAFADGHAEIHRAPDGNFAPWEAQHVPPPPPAAGAQPGQ